MKKISVLTIILSFSFLFLSAQDYRNIITSGTAFYTGTWNQTGFLSGLKYDSKSSMGNGDTLFLATNTIRDFPYNTLLDTTGGILGRKIFKMHDGWFHFINKNEDTIYLNCNATLNEKWKFCNLPQKGFLEVECTAIQQEAVLGINEFVKVLTFQAKDSNAQNIQNYYNGLSVKLGQQLGLVTTFDLYHMPVGNGLHELAGRNEPSIGFQGLTWRDVYDFEVGHEFHFHRTEPFDYPHESTKEYDIIRKVLSKSVSNNSLQVTYTLQECSYMSSFSFYTGPSYEFTSDTISVTYPFDSTLSGSSINWFPEDFSHTSYRYYSALYHLIPGKPAYGKSGNYYACCWTLTPYPDNQRVPDEAEYAKGLGVVHTKTFTGINYYHNIENMVYFKKGAEVWGTPVAASCAELAPSLSFHPDTIVLGSIPGVADTLYITANKDWSFPFFHPYDYTIIPSSGTGNAKVVFKTLAQNTGGVQWFTNQLTCSIFDTLIHVKILSSWDTLLLTFTPAIPTLPSYAGGTDTLFITSNGNWHILGIANDGWLTFSPKNGTGNGAVIFTSKSKNTDSVSRVARFGIYTTSSSKFFFVRQLGLSSGITEKEPLSVNIAPNPMRNSSKISIGGINYPKKVQLEIFDLTGRLVFRDSFRSSTYRFDRGNLAPGIYLLKIYSDPGTLPVQTKIILN